MTVSSHERSASGRVSLLVSIIALVVAMSGTAYAAVGRPVLLGSPNQSKSTTVITSTGTPLKLLSTKGAPPLAVESTGWVRNLNSDLLDGLDASAFARQSALPPSLTGYTLLVAGTSCPQGSSLVGLGGQYGAEDEASAGFGSFLYQVSPAAPYRIERDVRPLVMTACRIG